MSKNNKYRYFIISALAVIAVVLVILFAAGKLDGLLDEINTSSSVSESLMISEISDNSSSESKPNDSSAPNSSKESSSSSSTEQKSASFSSSKPQSSSSTQSTLKFRNKNLLNQHYQKHGIDMGFASAEAYEEAAARVPYDPDVLHKIEKEDGDDIYYIESTNEFVVVSTDGYLRTYFNPDRGIDYFNRQ